MSGTKPYRVEDGTLVIHECQERDSVCVRVVAECLRIRLPLGTVGTDWEDAKCLDPVRTAWIAPKGTFKTGPCAAERHPRLARSVFAGAQARPIGANCTMAAGEVLS
jgi:hypothetical protein